MKRIFLVGNPNCGKTTLFNALTGDNQRIGNWPGVTVFKKTGKFSLAEKENVLTDLPGIYSLVYAKDASQDEQIAASCMMEDEIDLLINVIDACHLERHLYLTSQLLELQKPMIVVLNMIDIAKQRGIDINVSILSQQLGCPVILMQANKSIGLEELKRGIDASSLKMQAWSFSPFIEKALFPLEQALTLQCIEPRLVFYYARRILEGDTSLAQRLGVMEEYKKLPAQIDIYMADVRYEKVHQLVEMTQTKKSDASEYFTAKLDRIVLHRFMALPIFLGIMYLLFFFAINVGGAFQEFFSVTTDAIFVQGTAWLLYQIHAPAWLIALCANGLGKGINTTLTFIPVLASMFLFLSILEASGYMARAAFIVDRLMRILGLSGKSFVPLIVGFGCNVPAIMAARTLDSERDRLLTVLMSPFMSCSARLAIYAIFVSAFFPYGGHNVVFSLYLMGIVMAVLTGLLLRKTWLRGHAAPLLLELPAYHLPIVSRILKDTALRLRIFIIRAGKIILPVSIIVGGLNAVSVQGILSAHASSESVLAWLGRAITPFFAPMGLQNDNWPATVGLLTGMLAKEVVIGSLNTLYTQMGQLGQTSFSSFDFLATLHVGLLSIPERLAHLGYALLHPILANTPLDAVSEGAYGTMVKRFDGKIGAYAYLLFILLYMPCVSTIAAIRQEANRSMMWFSVVWSFLVAYVVAVLFYQGATFGLHPIQTIMWFLLLSMIMIITVTFMALSRGYYVTTNS